MSDEIGLRIVGVDEHEELEGAHQLTIRTTRGSIPMVFHRAAEPDRAVLCVGGASGGFSGPAKLYARLGQELSNARLSVARIDYREPNEFGECLLDAMAGLSFLRAMHCQRAAVVGHSFGGAVAINSGTLSPIVTTVVAISSQLAGAHVVEDLAPRSLLLVHGTSDTILSHQSSEAIFERAREPKTLKLLAGGDHIFTGMSDELFAIVSNWLVEKV